jgi:hypothetical protein
MAQRMDGAGAGGIEAEGRSFPCGRKALDVACFSSHTSLSGGGAWERGSTGDAA